MLEDSGKKESQQPERRVINLGQEFHPFDPSESTVKIIETTMGYGFKSKIDLEIGEYPNLKIPINIKAKDRDYLATKEQGVTPFNPELGYIIDNKDYSLEERQLKMQSLREKDQLIDSEEAPFELDIKADDDLLREYGFTKKKSLFRNEFKIDILHILRKIIVQVKFMGEDCFEARPYDPYLATMARLFFDEFYPQKTGRFPTRDFTSDPDLQKEGVFIYLPRDRTRLKQIRIKFEWARDTK